MGELGSCVLTMRTALWEEEEKCAKCINSQWWILSFECFTFILEFHCLSRHPRGKKYIGSKINCSSSGNVQPHKSPYGDAWWGEVLVSLSRSERRYLWCDVQKHIQACCAASGAWSWLRICLSCCSSALRYGHTYVGKGKWVIDTFSSHIQQLLCFVTDVAFRFQYLCV